MPNPHDPPGDWIVDNIVELQAEVWLMRQIVGRALALTPSPDALLPLWFEELSAALDSEDRRTDDERGEPASITTTARRHALERSIGELIAIISERGR